MTISGKTAQSIVVIGNYIVVGVTALSALFTKKAAEQNKKDLVNMIDSRIDEKIKQ